VQARGVTRFRAAAAASAQVRATPKQTGVSASTWLLAAWGVGAALFLMPVATGLWQVRRLRRSAAAWPERQAIVDGLAGRRVEVLVHNGLAGPMTCGVWRPAIVLPCDAAQWAAADLERALVHELEHVRRGDWAMQCMARAVCAVYWFNPLVWMAWRKLALEAERACDDAVLARSEATAYADQLVELAERLAGAKAPLLAMASRADLTLRVGAVLDGSQRRGRASQWTVCVAGVVAAGLAIAVAPLRVVRAQQAPRFSAVSDLVMEAVTVKDKDGKPLVGLTADDFAVTEGGIPQTIKVFEFQKLSAEAGGEPLSYYLLGFYSTNTKMDGQYRRVRVTVTKGSDAKLDSRMGYYGTKSFQAIGGDAAGGSGVAGGVAGGIPGGVTGGVQGGVASGVTAPIPLFKPEPEYSEAARKAKYQGTVVMAVTVDATGRVGDAKVIRSLGLGLDEKAIEAVQKWRFRPGTKDGKAVAVQTEVEMSFRLL
jgi:TonB family protein